MKSESPAPKPQSATQPTSKPSAATRAAASQPTSGPVYEVAYVPGANIVIDGKLDEKAWDKADVVTDFHVPHQDGAAAPPMEFRAMCDDVNFYFAFKIYDQGYIVADELKDKTGVKDEDRPELFFTADEKSDVHYGLEIDAHGRIHDFSWSFGKFQIDNTWSCPGAKAAGDTFEKGYIVEGLIPLATFKQLGMQSLKDGGTMRVGLFRGCYYKVDGKVVTKWVSWVDLKKPKFGFHSQPFFGTFRLKK